MMISPVGALACHTSLRSRPRGENRGRGSTPPLSQTEGPGLSPEWLAAADIHLRIPMERGVDSLNVATAAAIAFYAAPRSLTDG